MGQGSTHARWRHIWGLGVNLSGSQFSYIITLGSQLPRVHSIKPNTSDVNH